jgi:lysylphosphatidylglycerol synthetase-like protein (DUF2156 family)
VDILHQYGGFGLASKIASDRVRRFRPTDEILIGYDTQARHTFLLGDPVCSEIDLETALKSAISRFTHAVFVQVHKPAAEILKRLGFTIAHFGVETELRLPYQLAGARRADIRLLVNRAAASGLSVKELTRREFEEVNDPKLLAGFSGDRARFTRPFSFLAGWPTADATEEQRVFAALDSHGQTVALSVFQPIYNNGTIIGQSEQIPIRRHDAPKGARTFVLVEAMKTFADDGITRVNLGLSPFYRPHNFSGDDLIDAKTQRLFDSVFAYGSRIFNFQGLAAHKSRYRGEEIDLYFASRSRLPLLTLWKLYRLVTGRWLPPVIG